MTNTHSQDKLGYELTCEAFKVVGNTEQIPITIS